jgi:hypothetical protein
LWAASLREIKQRIRPLFTQERVATNAGLFVEGLLGDEQRKTGWMRAEAAGDPGPWRQQAILRRGDSAVLIMAIGYQIAVDSEPGFRVQPSGRSRKLANRRVVEEGARACSFDCAWLFG